MNKVVKLISNILFFVFFGLILTFSSTYFFHINSDLKILILQSQPVIFVLYMLLIFMGSIIHLGFKSLPFAAQLLVFTTFPIFTGFLISVALTFYGRTDLLPIIFLISLVSFFISIFIGLGTKIDLSIKPSVYILNLVPFVFFVLAFAVKDESIKNMFLISGLGFIFLRSFLEILLYCAVTKETVKSVFPKTLEYNKEILAASLKFLIYFISIYVAIAGLYTFTVFY